MAIIYNNNVEETEIMSAYGLTVYGKVNLYEWGIWNDNKVENALITFRITDKNGNDVFNMYMGNRFIFQQRIDDTLDNFLYWIATENPDTHMIEDQVYKSLCSSNSLFNHRIQNEKLKAKQKEEDQKWRVEREDQERKQIEELKAYCDKKGYFYIVDWDEVTVFKVKTESVRDMLFKVQNDTAKVKMLIDFAKKYHNNKDVEIVKQGTMEEILNRLK